MDVHKNEINLVGALSKWAFPSSFTIMCGDLPPFSVLFCAILPHVHCFKENSKIVVNNRR